MSDKELLELAAKAHGSLHYEDGLGLWIVIESDGGRGKWWNPLADDGDALRLAVKLELLVDAFHDRAIDSKRHGVGHRDWIYGENVRDAIVRCAAEIGRQMQECNP